MQKHQRAFSLFEMLITLIIISIVIGFSLPSLNQIFFYSQHKILQAQLLQAIRLAQKESYLHHQAIGLCKTNNQKSCSGDWTNGQLIFINDKEDGQVENKTDILTVLPANKVHGKLYWRAFPYYRNYLLFSNTTQDNGTFWFCNENQKPLWAIVLSSAGIIKVRYPDKEGMIKDGHGKDLNCG